MRSRAYFKRVVYFGGVQIALKTKFDQMKDNDLHVKLNSARDIIACGKII